MNKLLPNKKRAENAILLIWIVLAIEIISFTSSCLQYILLLAVENGAHVSEETATANDMRKQIVGILYFIAFSISGITFIMWFRRAYYNLHQRLNVLSHSEGWAAGSWFVPFINLYRPYQIMKELYGFTKAYFRKKGVFEKIHYTTDYLGWWWALWLITCFVASFVFRISRHADTIDDYMVLTIAQIIWSVLEIPLAFITIKVIKDYAKAEQLLSEITEEMEEATSN